MFKKTVYQVTILSSTEDVSNLSLEDISYLIQDGGCSGKLEMISSEEISSKQMVEECHAQYTDPSFFSLDEDGNYNL